MTDDKKKIFFSNNFDLVRLFAASQVVFFNHYAVYFDLKFLTHTIIAGFSGVPIFFFVSGFLISASYERNSRLPEYAQNRILRIFPALWMCLAISIASIYISGYPIFDNLRGFAVWFITQLVFPVYNPDFLRGYGVGVVNGSLWTIPVELQFYILIPIFYALFRLKSERGKLFANKTLLILLFFYVLGGGLKLLFPGTLSWDNIVGKLYGVSFIPNVFLFLIGMFFQQNFDFFYKYLHNRFPLFLILHVVVLYITKYFGVVNAFGFSLLPNATMALCIFSFAYSYSGLSEKLLKGNDIFYGVYIYHMPVANFLIFKYSQNMGLHTCWIICVIVTYSLASLSWFFVEKPCLKLKNHPLNPIGRRRLLSHSN